MAYANMKLCRHRMQSTTCLVKVNIYLSNVHLPRAALEVFIDKKHGAISSSTIRNIQGAVGVGNV